MPALVAGIHVFFLGQKDLDGRAISAFTRVFRRAMPGHDALCSIRNNMAGRHGPVILPHATARTTKVEHCEACRSSGHRRIMASTRPSGAAVRTTRERLRTV